jgi:putative pyruvate formate lyase activating enzyme
MMPDGGPAYLTRLSPRELTQRPALAARHLRDCRLCPWDCRVDRAQSKGARCRSGVRAVVASFYPHFGQDALLSGSRGSGAIYFAGCPLRCCYCINAPISQAGKGREVSADELAAIMLHLQGLGCHNINLINPTHFIPQILEALLLAVEQGLRLPLVYKSSGYEKVEILQELLDGIIDLYMPDLKYADAATAQELSGVPGYPEISQAAAIEMYRQVGDLQVDERGLAQRGLIAAHLALPGGLANTGQILSFLHDRLSPHILLCLPRYQPAYLAVDHPPLNRPIQAEEYRQVVDQAIEMGFVSAARYQIEHSSRTHHDEKP